MREKLLWIWNVWRPLRAWFVVLLLLTVLSTAVAIAYPLVFMYLLNELQAAGTQAVPEDEYSQLALNAVLLLLAVGVARFLVGFYPGVRQHINLSIEKQVRETYFAVILRKGYRFFLRFRTGDLVTRLTDDISDYPKIAWFCCSGIFRAVESGSKFVFCLAVMLILDWRLALLAIAPLPVMIFIFTLVHRRLAKSVEAQRKAISATNDLLESSFSGVRIIKAYNAENRHGDALRQQLDDRIEAEMGVVKMWQLIDSMYNSLNVVGQIVVVAVGGLFIIYGELSIGAFYAFYTYLGMLVAPLLDLPNLFVTGRQAFVCIDREEELRLADMPGEGGAFRRPDPTAHPIITVPATTTATTTATGPEWQFESLAIADVRFAYPIFKTDAQRGRDEFGHWKRPDASIIDNAPLGPDVLSGINLTLHRGDRVAVVGRLGMGKSTLLELAAGALVPTSGTVMLNGHPLRDMFRRDFGRLVGLVPQEPVLFSTSIRENVVFGREENDDLLREAIDAVGMTAEIAALPDGLDQEIGQRGLTLSGGQQQRLTIARAIYGRPQLLLLDDLTSALDAENEDRLWKRLDQLTPGATLLVVTHRIATARAMNRVCLLDHGRIAAMGTHAELVQHSPLYREFQHQLAAEANALAASDSPSAPSSSRATSAAATA